ncbi:stage V sporulation protein AB [Bacillus massiliigorillae]|uniref:stage V sporulation protein AB n=1 Tax=Bacillus massiliigorillae TaxID=1243664 RepID=UPI0003A89180|nr:stage V sporulation protein AB [Bacillus massiliigorillae]
MIILIISVIFVGLASGFAVGAGFVAFLTVLGVIPRITQLTKTQSKIHYYEVSVIAGVVVGGWISLNPVTLHIPVFFMSIVGALSGIFNGMLAAALTEVINVLPILAKRIGFHEKIVYLLMAMVFGKICGSLFQWIYFIDL